MIQEKLNIILILRKYISDAIMMHKDLKRFCKYCNAKEQYRCETWTIEHKAKCPILEAKKLLSRLENEK